MANKRYAIKVMLGKDDWIYMTHSDTSCYNLAPVLFNTRKEAVKAKQMIYGDRSLYVKVVEYEPRPL